MSWIFMQAYVDGNEQILKRVEPQASPQNWGWKLSSCLSLLSCYLCNASKLFFKCKIRSWALIYLTDLAYMFPLALAALLTSNLLPAISYQYVHLDDFLVITLLFNIDKIWTYYLSNLVQEELKKNVCKSVIISYTKSEPHNILDYLNTVEYVNKHIKNSL